MDPRIRRRSPDDLPGCVAALAAVHGTDRYPMVWPGDPAGWLAPDGLLGAWVATVDDVVAGHVLLTADVGIAPVATVGRLFVAPGDGAGGSRGCCSTTCGSTPGGTG
ncbi:MULTISPECIES: hypothetical protein [unclassified Pseudonocardia]|uniref:hypothetical protein n=1 Tax=unclassified Pseudonocardia TaxID=2619320 RepID=UPI000AF67F33|nr:MULTISPECIES: hypothetical protein [unclassified Pseudonocardia]